MWVRFMGGGDPLETGMATHSHLHLPHNLSSTSPQGSPFLSPAFI